ncbi:hypothetical protein [Brachybacterium paraconglomeratum]|uniref:hypothetical protein n=1 Tax=Brachybacterium paraconglomeratum TaxID=173362 RepID=UPI0022AED2CD|nr:hypothetical protein [Brachybacterium paraconglomeratum]MCZ4324770.1 hypothetical protein [Brachybacterium paraconglomeratum]
MSVTVTAALASWRAMRDEFELYREAAYTRAVADCRGVLLTPAAVAAGISAYSLFIGPEARALRWASEELREWWAEHGRPTVAEFEAAWHDDRYYGAEVTV